MRCDFRESKPCKIKHIRNSGVCWGRGGAVGDRTNSLLKFTVDNGRVVFLLKWLQHLLLRIYKVKAADTG